MAPDFHFCSNPVLQPENANDVTDVDFSKCGVNYCPQNEETSTV
jgi:hypothetical protein